MIYRSNTSKPRIPRSDSVLQERSQGLHSPLKHPSEAEQKGMIEDA